MTSPVISIAPENTLDAAYKLLAERRISAVPVVDEQGRPLGVLSETDILRAGRMQPMSLAGLQALDLPAEPVRDYMHAGITSVSPDTSVRAAAKLLADERIHRVYVASGDTIEGVFSTEEVLVALRGARIGTPIGEVMTHPVSTLHMHTPLAEAVARLDHAGITGLAVVDEHGHPIGVFTKTEALKARERSTDTRVEDVMSFAMLYQNARTPIFRAAAHAYETGTRRILVMEDRRLAGILTGLDFARILGAS